MKLVYKSLTTFIICCCFYSLFISICIIENYKPIGQNQGNIIATQDFIYEKSKIADYIIVGSSLSYRMQNNMLPGNYWNLSSGGGSLFKGLDLIQIAKVTPKVVLIETNIIERSSQPLAGDFNRIEVSFRKFFPITQEKYKPVSYFINLMYQSLSKSLSFDSNSGISKKASKLMDELQLEAYSKEIDTEKKVLLNISRLKKMVSELEEKGVCVVFFEMPISCSLYNLPKSISVRRLFAEHFPDSKFNYVELLDCSDFETTDGVHLNESSAIKMLHILTSYVEINNCNSNQ